ncbi:hypothetical protein CP880_02625 [Cutibacterium namnetense]|uniref:Uncharacterized protein n=1 Tax=Cutibacterium namnetense TaxID=1574624 RepID=A0ABX9IBK3_9ACTN|nr:hypothetical protein CP880_02625 [Cutibacterium namnetense]
MCRTRDVIGDYPRASGTRMATVMTRRYAVLRPVLSMRGLRQRKDETCCEPMRQEPYEPATSARR